MITYLKEILGFGHMTTSTIQTESRDKFFQMTPQTETMTS